MGLFGNKAAASVHLLIEPTKQWRKASDHLNVLELSSSTRQNQEKVGKKMSFLGQVRSPSLVGDMSQPWDGSFVCWSRMQAEAGQRLDAIIARKERERRAGGGMFLWGVGNAPSTAIAKLARLRLPVPIVFSMMKSKPKAIDVAPSRTVMWKRYIDENGVEQPIPSGALVTSRGDSASGAKTRHYALMCYSEAPLTLTRGIPFDPSAFRNVGGTGAPVGASQVTALLRQVAEPVDGADYEANVTAWLTGAYWARLSDPQELDAGSIAEIEHFSGDDQAWLNFLARIRLVEPEVHKIACGSGLLL